MYIKVINILYIKMLNLDKLKSQNPTLSQLSSNNNHNYFFKKNLKFKATELNVGTNTLIHLNLIRLKQIKFFFKSNFFLNQIIEPSLFRRRQNRVGMYTANTNYYSCSLIKPSLKSNKKTENNYYCLHNFKKNIYILPLINQNKNKKFFLKKNLVTIFFIIKSLKSLNSQTFFKVEPILITNIFFKNHISLILKKFKKYSIFFGGLLGLTEFVFISISTLVIKDLIFLKNWLKKKFENLFYRKHKRLLYLIKLFFTNYVLIYLPTFKCLGFFFKLRGKIGVGGNSKKKTSLIKIGCNSLTTKKLKFNFKKGNIRTLVGTLGFTLMLFYC